MRNDSDCYLQYMSKADWPGQSQSGVNMKMDWMPWCGETRSQENQRFVMEPIQVVSWVFIISIIVTIIYFCFKNEKISKRFTQEAEGFAAAVLFIPITLCLIIKKIIIWAWDDEEKP